MGWEMRGQAGPYYTRSRRVRGHVVRDYFGQGQAAEAIALDDDARRVNRVAERQRLADLHRAHAALRTVLLSMETGIKALTSEVLNAAGYHEHRGQWRRRRR